MTNTVFSSDQERQAQEQNPAKSSIVQEIVAVVGKGRREKKNAMPL